MPGNNSSKGTTADLNRIGSYMYIGLGWMVVLVMPVVVQSLTVTELSG